MKKVFIVFLVLPGWFLTTAYLIFEYQEYGPGLVGHLFDTSSVSRVIFHIVIMLAPVASTSLGVFANARIKLLERLSEMNDLYRDYYSNAPCGYHSIGPDMVFLDVNDTWLEMFGYRRDEVVGRIRVSEMFPEEDRANARKVFNRLIESGRIENEEMVITAKDGSRMPVLISSTAVYDDRGEFLRSRTIVQDDTERKQMDNILREIAAHWSSTFDSMPWGVMLLDREYRVLRTNGYLDRHPELMPKELALNRCRTAIEKLKEDGQAAGTNGGCVEEYHDEALNRHLRMYMSPVGTGGDWVASLVDVTDLRKGEKKLTDSRNAFFNMLKDASMAYNELEEVHRDLIRALANAIDAKSPWTKGHSERVTRYAMALAEAMDLPQKELETLRTGALLHDLGKIGTYDFVLDKTTTLTTEEYEQVKRHPSSGADILKPIGRLSEIVGIVRSHHEHYDGKGYPDGLKGGEIPKMARILCIADSYDSMTADRPYRAALGRDYAMKELKDCAGTHFDPEMVKIFIKLIKEMRV